MLCALPPQYAALCDACGTPSGEPTPQGLAVAYPTPFDAIARATAHGFKASPCGLLCPACQLGERERVRGLSSMPAPSDNVTILFPPKG